MPSNFAIFEKIYIQRLIFLTIFGISTSLQLFLEKPDPEVQRNNKYMTLIAMSKEIKQRVNKFIEFRAMT